MLHHCGGSKKEYGKGEEGQKGCGQDEGIQKGCIALRVSIELTRSSVL